VFGKADRWLFWATASGFEWPARFNRAADAARQCGALSSELDSGAAHVILQLRPTIIKSDAFAEWIDNLRDRAGAAQVLRRLARLERGNPGNVAPVGEGLSELKIDFGPGYRVYFGQRGDELVIILCAGDKSSQDRDIKVAKKLWSEWKEQNG
jgi:putative addiction module killer protein